MKSIPVSGLGITTPLGTGVPLFWDNLIKGISGIRPITVFDTDKLRNPEGGEITDCPVSPGEPRCLAFVRAAVREAISDAGFAGGSPPEGTALVLGTNFGAAAGFTDWCASRTAGTPDTSGLRQYRFQYLIDTLRSDFGITGPGTAVSIACASGLGVIDIGLQMLADAPAVICAAVDELSLYAYAGLNALRAITKERIRPFTKNRGGTQFGEGAAAVILEKPEALAARQGRARAAIEAVFVNNDAYHTTAPDQEALGITAVMEGVFSQTDIPREKITFINTHGTGTKYNDVIETKAIKNVFGSHAPRLRITALKAMTAHAMGAAGLIEFIATVRTLETGIIPPTINYDEADEELDLNCCPNQAVECAVDYALTNSFGIGGANASVLLARAGV